MQLESGIKLFLYVSTRCEPPCVDTPKCGLHTRHRYPSQVCGFVSCLSLANSSALSITRPTNYDILYHYIQSNHQCDWWFVWQEGDPTASGQVAPGGGVGSGQTGPNMAWHRNDIGIPTGVVLRHRFSLAVSQCLTRADVPTIDYTHTHIQTHTHTHTHRQTHRPSLHATTYIQALSWSSSCKDLYNI